MKFFNLIQKKAQFKKYIEDTLQRKSVKSLQDKRREMVGATLTEAVKITDFSQVDDFLDNLDDMGDQPRDVKALENAMRNVDTDDGPAYVAFIDDDRKQLKKAMELTDVGIIVKLPSYGKVLIVTDQNVMQSDNGAYGNSIWGKKGRPGDSANESMLSEKKATINIDWMDDEMSIEKALKKYGRGIKLLDKNNMEGWAEISGDSSAIKKFLMSDIYGWDADEIDDIFGDELK